jgi:arylsulfatase
MAESHSFNEYLFRDQLTREGRLQPPRVPARRHETKQPKRHHDARPNVLWLMADQYRGDMLGCLGHPAVKTPNLDRLAARGVAASRAYCSSPVCLPCRASMLSSRFLGETEAFSNRHPMRDDIVTFPNLLADAGYRTANIGKTHCGRPSRRIFEYNANAPDAFGATAPTDVPFDPDIFPGCVHCPDARPNDPNRVLYGTYPGPPPTTKSYRLATLAERFLYWHDDPRPFFLRVSFDDPHPPVVPPEPYASMYSPDDVPDDLLASIRAGLGEDVSATIRTAYERKGDGRIEEQDHRWHAARYMGLCSHLDAQIGRVLDALDEYDYTDNTLVLFNADHGHMIGDHGGIHKMIYLWEGVNRIPTILAWPGKLPEGKVVDALVDGVDVAPTFLDALDVPIPDTMHGRSILPLARGEVDRLHEHIVVQWSDFGFAIYDDRYKLITYDSDADVELYDLVEDPWEASNLAHRPDHAERLQALQEALDQWRAAYAAPSVAGPMTQA